MREGYKLVIVDRIWKDTVIRIYSKENYCVLAPAVNCAFGGGACKECKYNSSNRIAIL